MRPQVERTGDEASPVVNTQGSLSSSLWPALLGAGGRDIAGALGDRTGMADE